MNLWNLDNTVDSKFLKSANISRSSFNEGVSFNECVTDQAFDAF